MNIDVEFFIASFNSERTIDYVITQVEKQVSSDKITVIDGFSKDKTVDIIKKHGCELIQTRGNLGEVRSLMIQLATTKYMAIIDSDLRIPGNWLNKSYEWLMKLKEKDNTVVAVFGEDVPMYGIERDYYEAMQPYQQLPVKNAYRLDTSNLLVETDAVRVFVTDTPLLEDYLLGKYLLQHGKSYYTIPVFVGHDNYETEEKYRRGLFLNIKGHKLCAGLTFTKLFLKTFQVSVFKTKPGFKIWMLKHYLLAWVYYFQTVNPSDKFYVRQLKLRERG
jgi:glycosyltransferase involved in cell wall biosynthesis